MSDRSLELVLNEIGRERYDPSPELVWRTKARLYRSRLLPVVVFLSIAAQSLTAMTVLFRSIVLGFTGAVLLGICVSLTASGVSIILILVARRHIWPALRQLEATAAG